MSEPQHPLDAFPEKTKRGRFAFGGPGGPVLDSIQANQLALHVGSIVNGRTHMNLLMVADKIDGVDTLFVEFDEVNEGSKFEAAAYVCRMMADHMMKGETA